MLAVEAATGFRGADWARERDSDLVELLDTGLDAVNAVAAAPASSPRRTSRSVGSGGRRLSWLRSTKRSPHPRTSERAPKARFMRSHGAPTSFPRGRRCDHRQDGDGIVRARTAGRHRRNGCPLHAAPPLREAVADPVRREAIDTVVRRPRGAEARRRVTSRETLRRTRASHRKLPCLRARWCPPSGGKAFAVRSPAAADLPEVIPEIKRLGRGHRRDGARAAVPEARGRPDTEARREPGSARSGPCRRRRFSRHRSGAPLSRPRPLEAALADYHGVDATRVVVSGLEATTS